MTHVVFDKSHWNDPIDLERMYEVAKMWQPNTEPVLICKVSEGITAWDDGVLTAVNARDVGWKHIGPYHFYDRRVTPQKNSDRFLKQWDKFAWTVVPTLDNELIGYMPNPIASTYPSIVKTWFAPVDSDVGKPGMIYSNVSFVSAYLQDPELTIHPLFLSQTSSNVKVSLGAPTVPLPWIYYRIWQKNFNNNLGKFVGASSRAIDIGECPDVTPILV